MAPNDSKRHYVPGPPRVTQAFAYAFAVVATVLALLVHTRLGPVFALVPFALYFLTVFMTSWVGGVGPGFVAVGLGALFANNRELPPAGTFSFTGAELVTTLAFVVVSSVVNILGARVRELYVEQETLAWQLERERDFRGAILRVAPAPMFVLNPAGNIVSFNSACTSLTGYPEHEVRGRALVELLLQPQDAGPVGLALSGLTADCGPNQFENPWVARDGTLRLVAWSVIALFDASGRKECVIGTGMDITHRKQAEREREELLARERQARREAEEATGLRDRLMAILSHDIRSPLNVITLSAVLLSRRGLGKSEARAVARIESAARRVEGMVQNLLDYSRARATGGIPVDVGPVELKELCGRAIDEARAVFPERRIELEAGETLQGSWDGGRLLQLLSNLLRNALLHGAPGAPVLVTAKRAGEEVALAVHNEGQPIPAELLPVLFEPFRRGPAAQRSPVRGLGLGLHIVREIARAHHGKVEVHSTQAEGTTVTVRLPWQAPTGAEEPPPAPASSLDATEPR